MIQIEIEYKLSMDWRLPQRCSGGAGPCCSAKKGWSDMAWRSLGSAGANVNLKEKRQAIYGKWYNDSLKFRKNEENTNKTPVFAI